ncbi:Alpha 1,6-fucosyltransferase [Operophtera brumata]|uniref:Alpha 1,6-fucosyltransferase n=1 Tax=Operophtera brumata TaxID=104452 RepID=A0A0L7LUS0_OPEBR|nr:Alpha 1,6-fucosyltransferase [Operophtera brumata]
MDGSLFLDSGQGPTQEYENLRRRIYSNTKELWYYVNHELSKLKNDEDRIKAILEQVADRKRSLLSDQEMLPELDGHQDWRHIEAANGWRYNTKGWEYVFHPISDTCTSVYNDKVQQWPGSFDAKVVSLPFIDSIWQKPKFLPLAVPKDLAHSPTLPLAHSWEYMIHVKDYFDRLKLTKNIDVRRVYLATDDASVGRVAYEMMQTNRMDASDSFFSLDDIYYFGGQNAHDRRAVMWMI